MKVLELPNFGHMTTSTISFESLAKFCFQNTVILRRPGVAIFADIIKIVTIFIKEIFKDSKVKKIIIYESKCNLYWYFLI